MAVVATSVVAASGVQGREQREVVVVAPVAAPAPAAVRVPASEEVVPLVAAAPVPTVLPTEAGPPQAAPTDAAGAAGEPTGDGREAPGPVVPRGSSAGIPERVLLAYRGAADRTAATDASCRIPWELLAGIGKVESGHAGGGRVDAAGRTTTPIRGPLLDGSLAGTAVITDSDAGRLDGDATHDRAVGPMQFLPGTWRAYGADADGDGIADPDDVDDAALGAARYLCASGADLSTNDGQLAALWRYNRSAPYAAKVLGWAQAYREGLTSLPAVPVPDVVVAAPPAPPAPPAPEPTAEPVPTAEPLPAAGPVPTAQPEPCPSPTAEPSAEPTADPSAEPTATPSGPSTDEPEDSETAAAEPAASAAATEEPTATASPTCAAPTASAEPTATPQPDPTTSAASEHPSDEPSSTSAEQPTEEPTDQHTGSPSGEPHEEGSGA